METKQGLQTLLAQLKAWQKNPEGYAQSNGKTNTNFQLQESGVVRASFTAKEMDIRIADKIQNIRLSAAQHFTFKISELELVKSSEDLENIIKNPSSVKPAPAPAPDAPETVEPETASGQNPTKKPGRLPKGLTTLVEDVLHKGQPSLGAEGQVGLVKQEPAESQIGTTEQGEEATEPQDKSGDQGSTVEGPRLECATKTRAKPAKNRRPPTLHKPKVDATTDASPAQATETQPAPQSEAEPVAATQAPAVQQPVTDPGRLVVIEYLFESLSDEKYEFEKNKFHAQCCGAENLTLKRKVNGENIEFVYTSGKLKDPFTQTILATEFETNKENIKKTFAKQCYDAECLSVPTGTASVSDLVDMIVRWSALTQDAQRQEKELANKPFELALSQGNFEIVFWPGQVSIGKAGETAAMIRIDENVKNTEDLEAFVAKKFLQPKLQPQLQPGVVPVAAPTPAPAAPQPVMDTQPEPQPQNKFTVNKFEFGVSLATSIAILTTLYLKNKNGSESKSALTSEIITDLIRIASDYTAFANSGKTVIDYGTFSLMVANLIEIISKFSELHKQNKKQKCLENINFDDAKSDEAKKVASTDITKLDKIVAALESVLTITRAGVKNWDCQKTSKYLTVAISLIRSQALYAQANENKKMKALAYTIAAIAIAAAVVDYEKPELFSAFMN